jgi:zinc resistance-associated protein
MWKAALAGVIALVISGSTGAFAQTPTVQASYRVQSQASSGEMESGIARFKAALRLTPDQERHWPRVESALREIARNSDQAEGTEQRGMLRRIGTRATEMVLSAAAVKRLVSAAQPLMKTLDDEQKSKAMQLARAMGFGSVAARFE